MSAGVPSGPRERTSLRFDGYTWTRAVPRVRARGYIWKRAPHASCPYRNDKGERGGVAFSQDLAYALWAEKRDGKDRGELRARGSRKQLRSESVSQSVDCRALTRSDRSSRSARVTVCVQVYMYARVCAYVCLYIHSQEISISIANRPEESGISSA